MTKTVQYWSTNRHIHKWNRIGRSGLDPHTYNLVNDKDGIWNHQSKG